MPEYPYIHRDHEVLVGIVWVIECWVRDIGVAAIFGADEIILRKIPINSMD